MRQVLVGVVVALLAAAPAAAQSPRTDAETVYLCIAVSGNAPSDAASLLAAIADGSVHITEVAAPDDCPDLADPPATGPSAEVGQPWEAPEYRITVEAVQFGKPAKNGMNAVAAFVTYEGIEGGNVYGVDWSAYAGDQALSTGYSDSLPGLQGGTLPPGRETSGWLIFTGRIAKGDLVTLTFGADASNPSGDFSVSAVCCRTAGDLPKP